MPFLLDLLPGELGQTLLNILPCLVTLDQRLDGLDDLVLAGTNLLRRVTVTQSEGVVLHRLEIHGNTERCAQLVVTRVPLADTGRRVVNPVRDTHTAEFGHQTVGQRAEGLVSGERNDQDLGGCDHGRERENLDDYSVSQPLQHKED